MIDRNPVLVNASSSDGGQALHAFGKCWQYVFVAFNVLLQFIKPMAVLHTVCRSAMLSVKALRNQEHFNQVCARLIHGKGHQLQKKVSQEKELCVRAWAPTATIYMPL